MTGAVASLSDAGEVTSELVARIAGFGPLQSLFQDESVEEIWINAPDRVFVARAGRHELTNVILRREQSTSSSSGCSPRPAVASTSPNPSSTRCCPAVTACTSCWRDQP